MTHKTFLTLLVDLDVVTDAPAGLLVIGSVISNSAPVLTAPTSRSMTTQVGG